MAGGQSHTGALLNDLSSPIKTNDPECWRRGLAWRGGLGWGAVMSSQRGERETEQA